MKFRLFRSRAFWFGVPGLVFLLWGWWISMGHWSGAGFDGARFWGIGQQGCEVFAVWNSEGGPEWGEFVAGHRKTSEKQVRVWKESIADRRRGYDPACRYVFIPYRWMFLAYVAGLAGLVGWRWRMYRALPEGTGVE